MSDEDNIKEDQDIELEVEEESSNPKDVVKSVREKLKVAQHEAKENMDGWQRSRADYANLQKKSVEQMENLKSYIIGGIVEDLLPVLDSFSMAMSNKDVWEKVDQNWRRGVEYILKQLNEVLEKYGVKEITVDTGDVFDPEIHQAVESVTTDEPTEDGQVESVLQKGYKMGNTIIRPTKVKTYKLK